MKKFKIFLALAVSMVFFVGCSSQPAAKKLSNNSAKLAAADKKDSDLVCFKVKRIGSHMSKKRCITKAQAAEEKRSAQEDLRQVVNDGRTLPQNDN